MIDHIDRVRFTLSPISINRWKLAPPVYRLDSAQQKAWNMLRIYLDQNKWIDLARAAVGHPRGKDFEDALAVCRAAVQSGAVSFPLDLYRYWETGRRGADRSRNQFVDVMRELSRQHTMMTPFGVLDYELDCALQRRYGYPSRPRTPQLFGMGIRHIAGNRITRPDLDNVPDEANAFPPGVRDQLRTVVSQYLEEALLRAGPSTYRELGFDPTDSSFGEQFVDFENLVADTLEHHNITGEAIDVAIRATDFSDIRPALTTALGNIGITYEQFENDHTVSDRIRFVDDLPTRYVTNVLRSAKHRQKQQKWEPHDFVDIVALPVAAVYCDVVVTEKQWVHRMRQGKIHERYSTRILSNVNELIDVIVSASVT